MKSSTGLGMLLRYWHTLSRYALSSTNTPHAATRYAVLRYYLMLWEGRGRAGKEALRQRQRPRARTPQVD
eukprot:889955-Rhodomonas_salina.1